MRSRPQPSEGAVGTVVQVAAAAFAGGEEAAAYDAAVDASPDVDRFCAQHAFALAAFEGLQPGREARVFSVKGGAGDGRLAFAERRAAVFGDPRPRRLWEPLEAMWGLCCPILGADVEALARALVEVAAQPDPPLLLLCGLRRGSPRLRAIVQALSFTHRLVEGNGTVRRVASLEGGLPGFLARRSPTFRRSLTRAYNRARKEGLRHERHAPTTDAEALRLYARAVEIDDRSWKGHAEAGLRATGLHAFYERMLPRLARAGALRMSFLVDPRGEDRAYLFGGIRHDTFRGLQFAFRAGDEGRSLGNVMQRMEVEALCEEHMLRYDLGVSADYKLRWGEIADETVTVIGVPRASPGPR